MKTQITVWLDETSDDHAWIVSEDDETGSSTIATFDTDDGYEAAVKRAKKIAERRGLEVVIE